MSTDCPGFNTTYNYTATYNPQNVLCTVKTVLTKFFSSLIFFFNNRQLELELDN